jgi:hypothetical protein
MVTQLIEAEVVEVDTEVIVEELVVEVLDQ